MSPVLMTTRLAVKPRKMPKAVLGHHKQVIRSSNRRYIPHLPAHDQTSADGRWDVLGGVDWNDRGLCSHADAEEKTCHEELLPVLGQGGADDGQKAEDGGEEDGTAAAKVVVQRVRKPASPALLSLISCTRGEEQLTARPKRGKVPR